MSAEPPVARDTHTRMAAAHLMFAEATAARTFAALRDAGVDALVLKGPSIDHWLYGAGDLRVYGDVDVLVAPDRFVDAERALIDLGYVNRYDGAAPSWAEEHADAWIRDQHSLPIDLHRRMWGVTVSPQQAWRQLWGSRAELRLGPTTVAVLSEPARALALALHVAHHGPDVAKSRQDLDRGLARLPEGVWTAAAACAETLGASVGLAAGLGLVPAGAALRDRLGLEPADREAIMVTPAAWALPDGAEGLLRLRDADGVFAKVRLLRAEAFPSATFMRTRTGYRRLADRGRRGLAAAYLWRLVHMIRGMPTAIRAAKRSRQSP